ncbi:Hypothetical Protein FCC1311_022982 [Hondaea fermentalgiana]|uniref:Late embryogenesis abundant protein LEA-2 subgroup domain-containing protein n=1 Tax=Hondaea fermentalgiana TaxID=2315210 RepID=A0A2R5G8H2_9STRA|nr:Hypothetical Protein FCC1311_022982 [Hondaea fermentalgiana]|eukprot:GBG26078.1 Hypothetical Protein FCC1311_022982 [Hondaea fermentalgiana]
MGKQIENVTVAVTADNFAAVERELDAPLDEDDEANRERRCKHLPQLSEKQARVIIAVLAVLLGITLLAGLLYERPVEIGLSQSGLDNVNVTMNTTDGTILMRGDLDAIVTNRNFVSLQASNVNVTLTKLDASVSAVQLGPVKLPMRGSTIVPLSFQAVFNAADTSLALAAISNECFYGATSFDVDGTVDIKHPLASGSYSFSFEDQVVEC